MKGDNIELLEDIKYRLERTWKHAKAQLDSLRDNYRDQIEFKTQRAVLILTILTVVLAALTAILAALAVPSAAWNWIGTHISAFISSVWK
jgi:Mg2+ and Co2+ transporter CorA